MISGQILASGLLILNFIPVTLLVLIRLKLARENIRKIFSALIISGMLWGDSTLLYRYEGFSPEMRLMFLHLNFGIAIVLVQIFFAFFVQFSGISVFFRTWIFWAFTANNGALAFFSFTGLVTQSLEVTPDNVIITYGPLYPWYIASALTIEMYGLFLMIRAYRKSDNDLLKFQMRIIFIYCIITFVLVNVMNVLLPNLLKSSKYSFAGPYLALLFFAGVFRIIFQGARLYALNTLKRMLKSSPFDLQENLFALREFIQAVKAAVTTTGDKSLRQLQFVGLGGETLILSLGRNIAQTGNAFPELPESIPEKWLTGFWDTIRRLEDDNRHLGLALIKAETIIQERWLSETVEKLPVRTAAISGGAYALADYLPAISKNIADNLETFGVEICTLSRTAFRQMAIVPDYTKGNQLIVFEGEPGSGKSSLAKAMNYYRFKKHNLTEIFCQNGNIPGLVQAIEQAVKKIRNSREKSGILVRNIEVLPVNMLSVFYPLIEVAEDRAFLYITSAPDYLRQLEGTADTLFHKFNQVKMQVPPLRRRDEDIFNLIISNTAKYAKTMGLQYTHISREFIEQAKRLSWQGNITELQNTLQREMLTNKPPLMEVLHLSDPLALAAPGDVLGPLERAERKVILDHLLKNNFNKNRTRIELDITVNTLNAKILKYGIDLPDQV